MAGLCIDAGAHKTRGAGDDGVGGLGVNEVIELRLAFIVVASDAHDVFGVGSGEVGIGINHCLPHAFRVVDVLAEDDRLGKAVGGFEEFSNLGSDKGGAFGEDEIPVEVAVVVFAIRDELAVIVRLPVFGPPAVEVFIKADADYFVRSKDCLLYTSDAADE